MIMVYYDLFTSFPIITIIIICVLSLHLKPQTSNLKPH